MLKTCLFNFYSDEESFDIVVEECLDEINKFLLIKRIGEVDTVCGKILKEEVDNLNFLLEKCDVKC